MTFWKFLHIVAMFGAVSIFVGQGVLSGAIASTGDVRTIRRTLTVGARFAPVGGALFILGIVFGFITAVTADLDLTQTWLLIAYGLAALILITGVAYHGPRDRKLRELVESSPDDAPSDALRAFVQAPVDRVVRVIDLLLWLGIIYVMVAKPFL
jgi:uncharacterized membrane protein